MCESTHSQRLFGFEEAIRMTRFRAYQLGSAGSSFSYFDGQTFTLIEARLNLSSLPSVLQELKNCGKIFVDKLHVTSWDTDHCSSSDLELILNFLKPHLIELPGYLPEGSQALDVERKIREYQRQNLASVWVQSIDTGYIGNLPLASSFGTGNVYWNTGTTQWDCSNDRSTVLLLRTALSLS